MRSRSTLADLAALVVVTVLAPAARGAIAYTPCTPTRFQCGELAVPLDRAGVVPGAVTLRIKRLVASTNPTATAVVALVGGPGEAALPFAADFRSIVAPALAGRDLIVFDQRGTGSSGRLRCPAIEDQMSSVVSAVHRCAGELGPARGFYRTADSVDDIEAIRVQSGYAKLVVVGVSYGTKVAEDYAARYPGDVESLVLDSVVAPEGPDVLDVPTFRAIPRVLAQLCAAGSCRAITRDPLRDLSSLVRRAGRRAISGTVGTPSLGRLRVRVDRDGLFGILLAGDANPTLRAELPGAMRSALDGDRTPLLRIFVRAAGLTGIPGARLQAARDSSDSTALLLATRCEESVFPWDRAAGADARRSQALAAAAAHPASDYAPFDFHVAVRNDQIRLCLGWPNASPPPAPPAPLPAVRTLLISGDDDLRTPRENARLVAARIPGAQLLAAGGGSPVGARVAGLRSGIAVAGRSSFRLRRVVYVTVSGRAPTDRGTARLAVGGRSALHGRLVLHAGGAVTGVLGGRRVRVHSRAAAARAAGTPGAWPAGPVRRPRLVGLG